MSGFSINQITLSGNLTRDPELRNLPSGTSLCSLRIANNTSRKDQSSGEWVDHPNYFDVTVWKGMGEWVARNLSKGDSVVVSGRIEWREWEKDGVKRQAYDVTADSIVTVGGSNGGQPAQQSSEPDLGVEQPPAAQAQQAAPAASNGHAPGSVEKTAENIQQFCICRPDNISDKCPIETHGIPF